MNFAARLADLRRGTGQSLQDVAKGVHVSKAHIWELERGTADNPSIGLVIKLADHFGVTVSFLIGEDIESSDADKDLQRMFRQARKLSSNERAILSDMMKSLLKRLADSNSVKRRHNTYVREQDEGGQQPVPPIFQDGQR